MKTLSPEQFATRADQLVPGAIRGGLRYFYLSGNFSFFKLTGKLKEGLGRRRIQFLYLHHVFEDEELAFRVLLRRLGESHRLIGYSEAVERIAAGNIDESYIAISFDDGFKNCARAGKIMNEEGVKGCFFICPSIIGETDFHKIKTFCLERLSSPELICPPVEFLNWDDVDRLLSLGHEIGSHTLTHANLAKLHPDQVVKEVAGSYRALKERIGEVRHFCWPFGDFSGFTPQAQKAVFDAGYESCASAVRGCHTAPLNASTEKLCIRRDHVVAKWPVSHVFYFLANNSLHASPENNLWPEKWGDARFSENHD